MPDTVRKHDEIFIGIQKLTFLKQHAGESIVDETSAGTAGAMQNQYRVADVPRGILVRSAEKRVVHAHFRQGFAGGEMEIMEDKVAFQRPYRCRRRRGPGASRRDAE